MTTTIAPSHSTAARDEIATLAIAVVAVFVVSLDTSVLYVAYPAIRRSFADVAPGELSWILNAYTITYGALLVPGGKLADRYGHRASFLAAMATFTLGSALCGMAPDVSLMIVARVIQGVGAAVLLPASFALVLVAFPEERRGVAIAVWGAVAALAAALGPAAGSALIHAGSWRWVFFANIPIGLVALVAGAPRLTHSEPDTDVRLPDPVGSLLLICALGAIAYAVVGEPSRAIAALSVVLAAFALAAFVRRSLQVPHPALDLGLFRRPTFAAANALSFVFSIGFTASFFGSVFFLTERWGLSVADAGPWLSPAPLVMVPVALLAGKHVAHFGYRRFLVAGGLAFAAAGALLLAASGDEPRFAAVWLPMSLLLGASLGLVLPSLSGAMALELDRRTYGVGGGVNQAVRQFGSVLGVAIVIVLVRSPQTSARFDSLFLLIVAIGVLTAAGAQFLPLERRGRESRSDAPPGMRLWAIALRLPWTAIGATIVGLVALALTYAPPWVALDWRALEIHLEAP